MNQKATATAATDDATTTSVAAFALTCHEQRATGIWRLERGKVRKEIFLRAGQAYALLSSIRAESLPAFLAGRGLITDAQHAALNSADSPPGVSVAQRIAEQGWLSEAALRQNLTALTQKSFVDALRWEDWTQTFVAESTFSSPPFENAFDVPHLVFWGLQVSAAPWVAMDKHLHGDPKDILRTPRFTTYREAFAQVFSEDVAATLEFAKSTDDLHTLGSDQALAVALEAACQSGLMETQIQTEDATPAVPSAPPTRAAGFEAQEAIDEWDAPSGVIQIADLTAQLSRPAELQISTRAANDTSEIAGETPAPKGDSPTTPPPLPTTAPKAPSAEALTPVRAAQVPGGPRLLDVDSLPASTLAEQAFRDGCANLKDGDNKAACECFKTATTACPDESLYRAYLGWSLFKLHGAKAVVQARAALNHAIDIDPACADAHEFLGHVAREQGDSRAAIGAFSRCLVVNPRHREALDHLLSLLASTGDFEKMVQICRELLLIIGVTDPPQRKRLWLELGSLYEGPLADSEAAYVAFEMAARLAPDDADLQAKVVHLSRDTDPDAHIRALTAQWRACPSDTSVGATLVAAYEQAGDAAGAAAAATVGAFRQGLPLAGRQQSAAASLHQTLAPEDQAELLSPGNGAAFAELFEHLLEAGIFQPEASQPEATSPAEGALPDGLETLVERCCRFLDVDKPNWFTVDESELSAVTTTPRHTPGNEGRALVFSRAFIQSWRDRGNSATDNNRCVFEIARSLWFLRQGRTAAFNRSGRHLKPYVQASLATTLAHTASGNQQIAHIRELIETHNLVTPVASCGQKLLKLADRLNASTWARAVQTTAARLALHACGDLAVALEAERDVRGAEAAERLATYASSPVYSRIVRKHS